MEEMGKVPTIDHLQCVRHCPASCALSPLILTVIQTLWGRYYQPLFIGDDTQRGQVAHPRSHS